jgi:NAD dependent epimerase/dehydratase
MEELANGASFCQAISRSVKSSKIDRHYKDIFIDGFNYFSPLREVFVELRGKKVLVTGADGFIGSHLVEKLLLEDCDVRAFVYYNSFNSWGWIDSFSRKTRSALDIFAGDIRDPNGVREAMKGIDVVFHLAALIAIPFSYHSPDSYVDTNIKGTLNVLQAARDTGCQKIMVTSTSEVYGTAKYVPIDELHPLQGQSPYSASKIGADRIAESFYRSFNLPVVIVRPFNTFGPRQSARAVIPTIIIQLLSGSKEIKLGSLHPTRDFIYVKDTVSGLIECAKSDRTVGEEINIATQHEISIGILAETLIQRISSNAKIVCNNDRMRPDKSEVERLLGSNTKISTLTEWKQQYTFERGIEETVKWFGIKGVLQKYKADIYNL